MRNPIMIGERIYLRALEPSDAEAMSRGATSETETFFERGRFPASPIAFEHMIREVNGKSHPLTDIFFAVCLKDDDRLIGGVSVDHVDWIDRTGETGSGVLTEFRGKGYGTEAKFLLLDYCFDRLHFHAIRSHVFEPNTRSAAALIKQGYKLAGRLKWEDVKNGVYRDTLVFDVLRVDFLAARDRWQKSLVGDVVLRDVTEEDLPIFFEYQLDPVATEMAAFPSRDRDTFIAHWIKVLGDDTVEKQTILVDGNVVGNVVSFEQLGERDVGYWIGREHWGKGIATKALSAFLGHDNVRPLYARVAKHNVGSIRVLEKCGFAIVGEERDDSGQPGEQVVELIMKLES